MFTAGPVTFLIPLIIYLALIIFVIYLVLRLIRSNEEIASNTERIAKALGDRNELERKKNSSSD